MKRGNTALKRGLGLASVFALAIAGAVVAAPAASAVGPTALTSTNVRATPIADAALISGGSLITSASTYNAANVYTGGSGVTTGNVPTIGVGTAAASGFQFTVPDLSAAAGSTVAVTLSNNATIVGTPSATVTTVPVALNATASATAGLDKVVGVANSAKVFGVAQGSNAAVGAGDTFGVVSANTSVSTTGGVSTLTVSLPKEGSAAAASNYGYLVTVSGVNLSVANNVTPSAVTVSADAGTNHTAIAYVSPFSVSIAKDAAYTATSKNAVSLPDVTVTQTSTNGFAPSAAVTLAATTTLSSTGNSGTPGLGVTSTAKVTPSSTLNLGSGNGTAVAGAWTVTPTAVDSTRFTSIAFSGLTASNVKVGSDITVSLSAPKVPAATTGESAFSKTPGQSDTASVTISAGSSVPRLAGDSRYATAQDIAEKIVTAGNGTNVILANGLTVKNGADALSANFLAGAEQVNNTAVPILLTDSSDVLPAATVDALNYLFKNSAGNKGVVNVFVFGKTDSVSVKAAAQAESVIKAAVNGVVTKVNVVRVAGDNRYETSAATVTQSVADNASAVKSFDLGSGSLKTAFLASGKVNADALAAGGFSAGAGIPVLSADGDAVDATVAAAIKAAGIQQVIVLGSTDRITDKATDALKADEGVKNVIRVAGTGSNGRYNTAALLNTLAHAAATDGLGVGWGTGSVYLANAMSGSASGFADALTVGPLAGQTTSVVLTVPQSVLPDLTKSFLTTNKANLTSITALGQTDRIADSVVTAAQAAIQ